MRMCPGLLCFVTTPHGGMERLLLRGRSAKQSIDETLRPRLIVFDLDNTVWNPELYQLGRRVTAGKNIFLCDGASEAMADLTKWRDSVGAVASRTHRGEVAEDLLEKFEAAPGISLASVLPHREIFQGSKRKHFQNLRKSTGVPYSDMIFFDDWTLNLGEVAQLGVLSIHTPRGLTRDLWRGGLQAYAHFKSVNTTFMGRMLTAHDLRELPTS